MKKFTQLKNTKEKEIVEEIDGDKLEGEGWEIVGINNIETKDPNKVEEASVINANLAGQDLKRGGYLWISAIVNKGNNTMNSMAVIKVRVVDMWKGLSALNKVPK